MMNAEIFSQTFQEEVYVVAPKPVVALPKPWGEMTEGEKILLEKILASAKVSLGRVRVIVSNKPDVLQWSERPQQVIAFGLDAPGLAQNEVLEIQRIKLIVTSSLTELETADKETKKKLVEALKGMMEL
jgi:hypothetical protein